MKKFLRFTAFVTLAAFLGLSAVESFHTHKAHQTTANCSVFQIAHRTPAILSTVVSVGPHWIHTPGHVALALQAYCQFVFVSHGLSPPIL